MRRLPLIALATLCLAAAGAEAPIRAEPADRGLAPYRLNPPPAALPPAQRGAVEAYRSLLERDLRRLERDEFGSGALARERLRRGRGELNRVERLLELPPALPPALSLPGGALLPRPLPGTGRGVL